MRTYLIIVLAVLVTGCATQAPNYALSRAEMAYEKANLLDGIRQSSAKEISQAEASLQTARALYQERAKPELVDHHALLSQKRSEAAKQRYYLEAIRLEIDAIDQQRDARVAEARETKARIQAQQNRIAQEAIYGLMAALEQAQQASQADSAQPITAVQQHPRGLHIRINGSAFMDNRTEVSAAGASALSTVAKFLSAHPSHRIAIEGHADDRGSADSTMRLSEQRAAEVQASLNQYGVASGRMVTLGLGAQYPMADPVAGVYQPVNDRVDIYLLNAIN